MVVQSHSFNRFWGQLLQCKGWCCVVLPVWLLASFFLGVTGGLASYVAVRSVSHRVAGGLLVLGLLWSFVLGFLLLFG